MANGQITILDLVDTATYIYYAEDNQGANATNTPNDNTKYVGIYCGPPAEGGQPEEPTQGMQIEWMSYVGPKGDAGAGIGPAYLEKRRQMTRSAWESYGPGVDESENWLFRTDGKADDGTWQKKNSHLKVGDTAYFQGDVVDAANNILYMVTFYGKILSIVATGIVMAPVQLVFGGEGSHTLVLDNDSDTVVQTSAGEWIGDNITVVATGYIGPHKETGLGGEKDIGVISVTPPTGWTINTHYTFSNNTLTINPSKIPANFSNGVFTFYWKDSTGDTTYGEKVFSLTKTTSLVDYDLVIPQTVYNSTESGGTVAIKVLKKTKDGTTTLTSAGSEPIKIYQKSNSSNTYRELTSWGVSYTKEQKDSIHIVLASNDGSLTKVDGSYSGFGQAPSIFWDEEVIEFTKNGEQGPAGNSLKPLKTYLRDTQKLTWWQDRLGTEENWQYNRNSEEVSKDEWDACYADIRIGDTIYFQFKTSDTKEKYLYHGRVTAIDRKVMTALGISLNLDAQDGEDGTPVIIKSQHYAIGDSGTTAPTPSANQTDADIWKTSTDQLTLTQGKYLWTRIIYLSDGEEVTSYSINYIAKDGENGDAYEIRTTSEDLIYFCETANAMSLKSLPSDSIKYFVRNKITGTWIDPSSYVSVFKVVFGAESYTLSNCQEPVYNFEVDGAKLTGVSLKVTTLNGLSLKTITNKSEDQNKRLISEVLERGGYIVYYLLESGTGRILATKPLLPRYGTSSEMAQFNITATSINQAVKNAYMAFTDTGLNLYNKSNIEDVGLSIYNESGKKVFYANSNGKLIADELEVVNGTFSGSLNSPKGTLGGFTIGTNDEGQDVLTSSGDALVLNGTTGKVYARDLTIGSSASIESYIALGDAKLYNPQVNKDHLVLGANGIKIYDNGILTAGAITIDGTADYIGIESGKWKIDGDKAVFENIDVSGTINSAVFNTNTVQAVGSTMLFMPSVKIADVEAGSMPQLKFYMDIMSSVSTYNKVSTSPQLVLVFDNDKTATITSDQASFRLEPYAGSYLLCFEWIVDDSLGLNESSKLTSFRYSYSNTSWGLSVDAMTQKLEWAEQDAGTKILLEDSSAIKIPTNTNIWAVKNNKYYFAQVVRGNEEEGVNDIIVTSTDDLKTIEPVAIIVIGEKEAESMVMGISSGESSVAGGHVRGKGLTISTFKQGQSATTPNLFLGELKQLGRLDGQSNPLPGYGLYCDNVYLRGALTTKLSADGTTYAGVNTINGEKAKWLGDDQSSIVFWAGAEDIQTSNEAPFQVTEQGSLYAKRARLAESLFVDGEIQGAILKTATIVGNGDTGLGEPGLVIYDTETGIDFRSGYGADNPTSTMTLGTGGISMFGKKVVYKEANDLVLSGDQVGIISKENSLSLKKESTDEGVVHILHHMHSEGGAQCGFYFEDGRTAYKIQLSGETQPKERAIFGEETKIVGAFSLCKDRNDNSFKYEQADVGYNLYITERGN